jgi:hypothetical protein
VHAPAPAVMVVEVTVCAELTVYVPMPPVPPTRAVMVVPAATPVPTSVKPTARLPPPTADTVRVEPLMAPVTEAPTLKRPSGHCVTELEPSGQKLPTEQATHCTEDVAPVPEKYVPAGQGSGALSAVLGQ